MRLCTRKRVKTKNESPSRRTCSSDFPRSGRENGGAAQHLRGKQHTPRAHWSSEGRARPMQRRGDEGICCSAALLSASPSRISAEFQLNRDPGSACRPQGLPLHGQHDVHLACLLRMVRSLSRFSPLSLRRNSPRRAYSLCLCEREGSLAHSFNTTNGSRISARLMKGSWFIEPGAATSTRRRAGVVSSPTHPRPGKTAPTMMPTGAKP